MMKNIEGVILDWAGTAVDFGCFAPVNVFLAIFKNKGIKATLEEARKPMGMLKREHIKAMLQMPRISRAWEEKFARTFTETDVDELYSEFQPMLFKILNQYATPIPGVVETIAAIRGMNLKIGSTTGYTDEMMEIVATEAKAHGYSPDCWVTPDSTNSKGRPYPYMIYKNMEALSITASWKVIKVGDTILDIKEGINAGVWSVGVAVGSSQMGLNQNEFASLSENKKKSRIDAVKYDFFQAGADFVIETVKELPELIERIDDFLEHGKRLNAI